MKFPYLSPSQQQGEGFLMPFIPIGLRLGQTTVKTHALIDSGASICVLPFSSGLALGAVWEEQKMPIRLTGNLASIESHILFVRILIEGCPETLLTFAWAKTDNVPLLLGQTDFFMEFDVFFSRSSKFFEVTPKPSQNP
jgi:hypothetical protein